MPLRGRRVLHAEALAISRLSCLALASLAVVLVLGSVAPGAAAVSRGCARVDNTPDGFLAVRSGPGPEHPEIDRLKPGQLVQIAAPSSLAPWQEVDVLLEPVNGKLHVVRQLQGYAHGRYLKRVDCKAN
jgi:hypothetical protein